MPQKRTKTPATEKGEEGREAAVAADRGKRRRRDGSEDRPVAAPGLGGLERASDPSLYTTIPPQPKGKKPGQLTRDQLQRYFREGYLVVPDFFQPAELNPVREGIAEAVDMLVNKLHSAGKIKDKCSEAGLFQRMSLIEKQFPGAGVLLHKLGYLPKSFRDLWSNERLLNVMEQLIGPDIAGHPVWNLRVKTPINEQATVPWHQDNAYLDKDALEVLQPTAWIPMLDVNHQNGCMQVIPGGHRRGVTSPHVCCVGGTWYVQVKDEEAMKTTLGVDIKDAVTVEMPYGGVLLMNNAIPHQSTENFSDKIRWSLDLRWQHPDKPNGFYGLKPSILMRSSEDPDHTVDFDAFDKINRHVGSAESVVEKEKLGLDDNVDSEFDTTIVGPWMKRWELVHHNRHTAKFESEGQASEQTSWHKA